MLCRFFVGAAVLASVLAYLEEVQERDAQTTEVRRQAVRDFANDMQGTVRHEYQFMPNVLNLGGIPEGQVAALEAMPGVQRVEIDEYHPNVLQLHDSIPLIRGLQSQITGAGYSADGAGCARTRM